MKSKMKMLMLFVVWTLTLNLCACSPSGIEEGSESAETELTWQGYYDLGVRYLSEGNYQEAILAFTAAIEIDPKQVDAYIGLADAYVAQGDVEQARQVLENALVIVADSDAIQNRLDRLEENAVPEPTLGTTVEPTPTSTASADTKLNTYGATKFELRSNYYAFSDMTLEEQQLIETIGNAALLNDTTTLYSLLESTSIYGRLRYTTWNGYKVKLSISSYSINSAGDRSGYIEITLRPENGIGYFCKVGSTSAISTSGRDSWFDYLYYETWITCPCIDWQWNGTLNLTSQTRSLYRSQEGLSIEHDEEETESGTMVNSLRDGIFTRVSYDRIDGSRTHTRTNIYQNGVLVEQNGELINRAVGGADIEGMGYSGPDNPLVLEMLYW